MVVLDFEATTTGGHCPLACDVAENFSEEDRAADIVECGSCGDVVDDADAHFLGGPADGSFLYDAFGDDVLCPKCVEKLGAPAWFDMVRGVLPMSPGMPIVFRPTVKAPPVRGVVGFDDVVHTQGDWTDSLLVSDVAVDLGTPAGFALAWLALYPHLAAMGALELLDFVAELRPCGVLSASPGFDGPGNWRRRHEHGITTDRDREAVALALRAVTS